MSLATNPLNPTFQGHIGSTLDALVLFEGCLDGRLNHVPRRPHDRERQNLIRSGNIFIYEEHASGIKRWTDGISWSPSRILGNFLIYRELDKPFAPGEKKRALKKTKKGISKADSASRSGLPFSSGIDSKEDPERALIGSLVDSYPFKTDGLVKKTISIHYQGVPHHLVSYYNLSDVTAGRLSTPSMHASLRGISPRPELLMAQNFRAPLDEMEYNTEERGFGAPAAYYASLTAAAHDLVSPPRAMSLPSFQPAAQSTPYAVTSPYGYMGTQPQQQHHHYHPVQHQASYVTSAPSSAPLPPMSYIPQSQGNYTLDPNRSTHFPSSSGMAHEFPRNMPSNTSPRRHSTFHMAQPSDMTNMSLTFPEGRPLPTNSQFFDAAPYFMAHRPTSIVAQDVTQEPSLPSPREMKTESGTLGDGDDQNSQQYNLEDNGAWGFEMSGDQQYYGGSQSGDGSHQWPGGPGGLHHRHNAP